MSQITFILQGKYALRDLVQRLPSGEMTNSPGREARAAAVCCALNEVVSRNAENARALRDAGGITRLVAIARGRAGK